MIRQYAEIAGVSCSRFVRDCSLGELNNAPIAPATFDEFRLALKAAVDEVAPLAARLNDCAREANSTEVIPADTDDVARRISARARSVADILDEYLLAAAPADTTALGSAMGVGARAPSPHIGGRRIVPVMLRRDEKELLKAKAHNRGVSLSRLLLDGALSDPGRRVPRATSFALCGEVHALLIQFFGCVTNLRQLISWADSEAPQTRQLEEIEHVVFAVAFRLRQLRTDLGR